MGCVLMKLYDNFSIYWSFVVFQAIMVSLSSGVMAILLIFSRSIYSVRLQKNWTSNSTLSVLFVLEQLQLQIWEQMPSMGDT